MPSIDPTVVSLSILWPHCCNWLHIGLTGHPSPQTFTPHLPLWLLCRHSALRHLRNPPEVLTCTTQKHKSVNTPGAKFWSVVERREWGHVSPSLPASHMDGLEKHLIELLRRPGMGGGKQSPALVSSSPLPRFALLCFTPAPGAFSSVKSLTQLCVWETHVELRTDWMCWTLWM